MPRLSLLLVVLMIAGCSSEPADPYAKYREFNPKKGMTIKQVKKVLGEPDNYDEGWTNKDLPDNIIGSRRGMSSEYPIYGESLRYGLFGTHTTDGKFTTMHRLNLYFYDGELDGWSKTAPPSGD